MLQATFAFRGLKRKTNIHPVDAIEDIDQLTAIIAKAFVEKKGVVTLDDIVRLREAINFDCISGLRIFVADGPTRPYRAHRVAITKPTR